MLNELFKNVQVLDRVKDLINSSDEEDALYPTIIDPGNYTTPDGGSYIFDGTGGDFRYFKYTGFSCFITAYEKCPPVAAIINRKAQAFINGKTWVLNSKDKVAQGPIASKLNALLSKPNAIQSWKQFEAQMYIYMHVFGFAIILPIKPFGFKDNIDASSLWNIPASWIDVPATQERFTANGGVAIEEIVVNFNGTKIVLKLSDLIIIKDFTPSFNTITFPASRLKAQEDPINNIIGAYESRRTLIQFRGALGILSQDPGKGQYTTTAMTDEQKKDLQRDFRRYGLRARQFQVILTTASLKWQSMGYPTKDLMLMEEVQESTISICGGVNFPPFILGLADTTYNNMTEALKGLYQDSVIPDACNIYEQLTSQFGLEQYNLHIDKDYNHIPILQKDKKSEAEARKAMNEALKIEWDTDQLTLDEWRAKNNEDPLPDGRGKLYKTQFTKLYGQQQTQPDAGAEGQGNQGQQTSQAA